MPRQCRVLSSAEPRPRLPLAPAILDDVGGMAIFQSRRSVLKGAAAAALTITGVAPLSCPVPARSQSGLVPREEDYFSGTAVDHGIEYRRTNLALIPQAFRPQLTRE